MDDELHLHLTFKQMCTSTLVYTHTFGTAAWKRKSVIGKEEELVAARVMAVTTGLLGLRSNENIIFSPFFSNTVMLGIPPTVHIHIYREKPLLLETMLRQWSGVLLSL